MTERLPDGHSTNTRLFLLSLTPTAQDDIASRLTEAQERKEQYPLAMSAYIQWIAQHWDTLHATLPKRFRELRQMAYTPGSHSRQASQVAYLQLAWETFTGFAVDAGVLDAATQETLLQDAWNMLTATARQQSNALQDEAPERRFLALLADGFASKRAYLANLNGDCPADGDAWGWVCVTRHDKDGDEYHELQRPPQGTLLGHVGEDWLYLFPEQAYQFVAKAARDANSVFPVESKTLLKHLGDAGYIATKKENGDIRRTLQQRIGTSNPRVIKLRRTALTELYPVITGYNTAPSTEPGTEKLPTITEGYKQNEQSAPGVPGNGELESHVRAHVDHDTHTYNGVNTQSTTAESQEGNVEITGYCGLTGFVADRRPIIWRQTFGTLSDYVLL